MIIILKSSSIGLFFFLSEIKDSLYVKLFIQRLSPFTGVINFHIKTFSYLFILR